MYTLFRKIKHLSLLSTRNLPLDASKYAQFGLKLLHTELFFLQQIFLKNGYTDNFINVSKDLWIT